MPKQYSQQEIQERFSKLPEPLKDAVFSVEVAEHIFETGKKYGLMVDKIGVLGQEVGRVIMGLTMPSEFVSLLMSDFRIDEAAARSMAGDLNRLIFAPLRDLLKNTHKYDISHEALQNTGPLAAPGTSPVFGQQAAESRPVPQTPASALPQSPSTGLPRMPQTPLWPPASTQQQTPPIPITPTPAPSASPLPRPSVSSDVKAPPPTPPVSPPPAPKPTSPASIPPPPMPPVSPTPGMDIKKISPAPSGLGIQSSPNAPPPPSTPDEVIKSIPPSQIIQQRIMAAAKPSPAGFPAAEHMQEAIFAPPATPQEQPPASPQPVPSTATPPPSVAPKPPAPPAKGDPYREPIE